MQHSEYKIVISVTNQALELLRGNQILATFPVSTSAFGLGSEEGSLKTPLGNFRICQKIGANATLGTTFQGRLPVAETDISDADRQDLVQTRILWLDGLDPHNLNTKDRYIYIHGTNHESNIGTPASHGCVRMYNADIITLFDTIPEDTRVEIIA